MHQQELNGLVALVTGATSGIGRATAVELARRGAHVIASGRDHARGAQVIEDIRAAGGKADFAAADLTDERAGRELAATATELGAGRVDILINNAGIFPFGPTHQTTPEDFDRVYAINVKAPYFLVAALAPAMAERGDGAIVNVSTFGAQRGTPISSLYGSTKAAIESLTRSWAAEFGGRGVRVNVVAPGPTITEGTTTGGDDMIKMLAAQTPAQRPATADEVASAIAFLAGPQSSIVHGAVLAVDGGRNAV